MIQKNDKSLSKGITLIALVITIIVLLILAAVSIATLTGENGILTKATESKQGTQKATAEEKVQLEALGSYDSSGNFNMEKLKENLKKNLGLTDADITDNSNGGITVKIDGYDVVVDSNGNVMMKEWTQTGTTITNGTITLKVGDYVNYNHVAGIDTTDTDITTYTSTSASNGYADQVFNINSYTGKWRVLGEEEGKILLISADIIGPDSGGYTDTTNGNKFYLKREKGYINCISELNKISSKYGQGTYAEGARSVTVEDINKITGYNPNNVGVKDLEQTESGTKYGAGQMYEYGNKVTYYWAGSNYPYYYSKINEKTGKLTSNHGSTGFNWFDIQTNTWKKLERSTTATTEQMEEIVTLESNYYKYYPETLTDTEDSNATIGIEQSSLAYNALFANTSNKYYWLGSQYANTSSSRVMFGARCVSNGSVNGGRVNSSNLTNSNNYNGIRPVVTLKSNLQLSQSGDEWVISQ